MPPLKTRTSTTRASTATKKGQGPLIAGVVGGGAVIVAIVWWLRSRSGASTGPPTPPPADPVVDVGDDQAVTLDITSHAEIVIPFSVVADNPVNLVWTVTSGPAPVNFSALGPKQELAEFQTAGTYFIRLTAIDAVDSRAQGFDELVVTVNEVLLAPILVPGELTVDGFASYILTRNLGDTISFVWPVQNVGDLAGAAFIQLTEAGAVVGTGAPFPINPGEIVDVNFNPVISLPAGVHILAATVMEGLPPDGLPVGSAQIITLTVVTVPILAAVGLPRINSLDGPTFFHVAAGSTIPISWPCQNTGGGSGRARLKVVGAYGFNPPGAFTTIPGFTTVTLLKNISAPPSPAGPYDVILTMEDDTGVLLGEWLFSYISP